MKELSLTPEFLYSLIKENAGKIESLEKSSAKTARTVRDMETEYPLLPPEADDLAKAVKQKGIQMMGGKSSPAYQNTDIRKQVYRDIYTEIKREYGLFNENGSQLSYKKLKRKYLNGAFRVVDNYELPVHLEEAIQEENDLAEIM